MAQSAFKAVFFDLDGTLVDIHRPLYAAARAAMAEIGHTPELTPDRYCALLAANDVWLGIPDSIRDEYTRRAFEHFHVQLGSAEQMEVLPHVETTLVELKRRGYATAVITSRTVAAPDLAQKLVAAGLAPHLDQVVTQDAESAMRALDKTESLRRTATRAAAHPRECVYVGDEPRDIMAATGAGFGAAIGVATGAASYEYLRDHERHRPHLVIRSMAELLDAIADLESRGGD
jgi:phosphoglycolate phosphatase